MIHNHSSMDSMHHEHSMMPMWFHFDLGDTILFKGWTINNQADLALACLVFLILAILYEWIKSYRKALLHHENSKQVCKISVIDSNRTTNLTQSEGDQDSLQKNSTRMVSQISKSYIPGLYQALLHILQVLVSYTLMLGFMSFQVWICLSILVGAGLGYLFFCSRSDIDLTDHCH